MLIIGEKLNGFIPAVGRAIKSHDEAFLISLAKAQEEAGANYLDVCAAVDNEIEVETLRWLIRIAEDNTSLPVCVDSPNPEAIAAVLGSCKREGVVNSVSLETGKIETIFPLIAKTNWKCVALLCSSEGVPNSVEDRISIFEQILMKALEYGISEDRILIDPIVRTLSTDDDAFKTFAECAKEIRKRSAYVSIVSGLSNISFGLPARALINHAFLVLAMQAGMDSAILDPLDREMMGLVASTETLLGLDEYCMGYITAFRENRIGPKKD
ncbi:MAG TPA: dihydropteroate synthase [Feifaniaceae bacterium]|nr:dihydropteroate synthase [Feifaniaceae bacterium]